MINDKFKTLVVLAKEKKYTKTAEICNISQPAVTQHIQSLESFYNIKIFNRIGRDLILTQDGELLVDTARKMIALNENIKKKLAAGKLHQKKLDIGITLTASNHFIPAILNFLKEKMPEIRYSFYTENVKKIYEKLRFGELDFAVIDGEPSKEFSSNLLFKDELIFIANKNHIFKDEITLNDLKKEKLILRDKKANTRIVFQNFLLNNFDNIQNFDIVLEVESTSLIKRLVIEGHGITLMSRAICQHLIDQDVIKEIKVKNFLLERGIYLIYNKENKNDIIINNLLRL